MTKPVSAVELLESVKAEGKAEGRTEAIGEVIEMLQQIDGQKAKKETRGRKPGSTNKAKAAKAGGPPSGEVYAGASRGRKQCPNCEKYVAARSGDCPNCGFSFSLGKVVAYKDAEGNAIVMPFAKKAAKAKAAKAVPAIDEFKVLRVVKKQLKTDGGISGEDLTKAVCESLKTTPCATLTAAIKSALKTSGAALDKTDKKFKLSA